MSEQTPTEEIEDDLDQQPQDYVDAGLVRDDLPDTDQPTEEKRLWQQAKSSVGDAGLALDSLLNSADSLDNRIHDDELTGLSNRRGLQRSLEVLFERSGLPDDHIVAVLAMDIDNFKAVNDKLGHDMGDRVLKKVSRVIKSMFRHEETAGDSSGDNSQQDGPRHADVLARWGGDEFAAILVDVDIPEGSDEANFALHLEKTFATRYEEALHNYAAETGQKFKDLKEELLKVSLSIGMVFCSLGDLKQNGVENYIKQADGHMYSSKVFKKGQTDIAPETLDIAL